MKIHLPNSAFLGNIESFIAELDTTHPEFLEISANEKWISVHPAVISMVAALGLTVPRDQIRCPDFKARSGHYFVRMGLFKLLGIPSDVVINEHEPAGRFIPLTQIRTSIELSRFITEMVPLLHLEPEPAKTICYIVSELVRNVLEHAETDNGAILCAQYYQKSNSIRIGIADTGCGILSSITRAHQAADDLAAIRLALTPGITGATSREGGNEQNAGAGLFFIKSIAHVNRDFFVIYSGSALYKLLKKTALKNISLHADPFDDRHGAKKNLPAWSGTVVGVDITLDTTAEFTRLLDAIRDTYSKAIQERRQAARKKPRFT